MWKYIYSKSLFITLYTEKIFFEQNKQNKLLSFFYHELQLITVLLLIRYSYTSWSTWFITLKLCVGFSIFNSVSFLLKFTLSFSFKKKSLFDFKMSYDHFQNKKVTGKPHTVLLPDLWFLHCNKKFQWYLRELKRPKNWLRDKLFKL